jgi:Amt family ammonium transporter
MSNNTNDYSLSEIDDVSWILSNSIAVLTMQVGFAVLETGSTKKSHCINIMLKNLIDMCISSISWFTLGWSIYSNQSSSFIGVPHVLRLDVCNSNIENKQIPYLCANIFFVYTFCSTMATIVSGAVAERMPFMTYLMFVCYASICIFPVLAHWVWNPVGFLYKMGFHDFAGASIVHLSGAIAGLILTIHIKPRDKVFDVDKSMIKSVLCKTCNTKTHPDKKQSFDNINGTISFNTSYNGVRDHVLVILGTIMLWIGWFGFNMGSTLGLTGNRLLNSVYIGIITSLGGSIGGVSILIYDYRKTKLIRPSIICSGILSGLVVTTGNIDILEIHGIFILAPIASFICYHTKMLLFKLQVDDPIDAIAVHGLPSILSLISCCIPFLLKERDNTILSPRNSYITIQLVGIICIVLWVVVNVYIFIWVCNKCNIQFIGSDKELLMGFDMTTHGIEPVSELGSQIAHTHLLLEGCTPYNKRLIQEILKRIINNTNINNIPRLVKSRHISLLHIGRSLNIKPDGKNSKNSKNGKNGKNEHNISEHIRRVKSNSSKY